MKKKHNSQLKVVEAFKEKGIEIEILNLDVSTKTSQEAADAVNCDIKQIAKSIVFFESIQKKLVQIFVSGPNRVNLKSFESQTNLTIEKPERLVLGADSVIDLNNEIISKPKTRSEALQILKNLNGRQHYLISSVCIVKNGSMIWNYTDKAILTMKNLTNKELITYLEKISDENLFAYNVYQIEGKGKFLFSSIEGDKNTIMGLPVMKIKNFLEIYE